MKSKLIRMRRAFTLIEMLVVVGIIAILMAILLPMVATSKEAARIVYCANNLSQIGKALAMYVDEHNDTLPSVFDTSGSWDTNLLSYLNESTAVFLCPSDPYINTADPRHPRTYSANGNNNAGAWKYPFGNYDRNPYGPARVGTMDYRKYTNTADIIYVGERPGDSLTVRGYIGLRDFSGLDQTGGAIHKRGAGANYLMGSGAVRFFGKGDVQLIGTTNYWLISDS